MGVSTRVFSKGFWMNGSDMNQLRLGIIVSGFGFMFVVKDYFPNP